MKRMTVLGVLVMISWGCDGEDRTGLDARVEDPDAGPTQDGGGGGCVDTDGDGYGAGCAMGADCDDTSASVSPAASEICDGVDQDCDGSTDEDVSAPACERTEGVCAGSTARCAGAEGFVCDAAAYGDDYEQDESSCDTLDNDCDGSTDEGCTCEEGTTQACGIDVGVCMAGTQTCGADETWGPCEGEVGPMGESCDGADNDCDGTSDEPGELSAPDCALQLGVCAGSKRACGGAAGWLTCAGTESYGGNYEATETACDELDNDCDGITDEGCDCVDGATQSCGSDVGACAIGTQTCIAGGWGGCAGEVAPDAEACNGDDDDCDGMTDEAVPAPACPLTDGVCAGATAPCLGEDSFGTCAAADYGADYEADETRCDGLDNDCDGTADEGCDCIDGRTQECGSSVGACERGTQTCAGGEWGACTGGVEPTTEDCNGLDDDCNGVTDDNLVAPACALGAGVCAGTTQVCGGTSGWIECAGTESYGPRFVASEEGATNELVCDGLDNDCDGSVDDGCASGPLRPLAEDAAYPSIHHRHLAYLVSFDGNWDVVFESLATGEVRRLTTTAANEGLPRINGNHVVYTRGEDAASRVVLYDLETDTETIISEMESGSPDLSGGIVVFEQFDGAQWDVFFHEIGAGTAAQNLLTGDTSETEERQPSIRLGRVAFLRSVSGGPYVTHVATFGEGLVAATNATNQAAPQIDIVAVGWTDARLITVADPPITSNYDVYAAPFTAFEAFAGFPGENAISTAGSAQILSGMDGGLFVFYDFRNGNWDPVVSTFDSAGAAFITTDPSTQLHPDVSGNAIVWADNRLGTFDIYGSELSDWGSAPEVGDLVINEVLADPPTGADVNGDGAASIDDDEFVEIVNRTGVAIRLDGLELSDTTTVRHVFAPGTVLPGLGRIVVFGDIAETDGVIQPSGVFGGARLVAASTDTLSLANEADTITLRLPGGGAAIDTFTYSGQGNIDQSLVRDPELTGPAALHTAVNATRRYSPGVSSTGFGY